MPSFETLHGDEEAIEISSDRFYPILQPFFSQETGAIDLESVPGERVGEIHDALVGEGYSPEDVKIGFKYAVQTLVDRKQLMEYM